MTILCFCGFHGPFSQMEQIFLWKSHFLFETRNGNFVEWSPVRLTLPRSKHSAFGSREFCLGSASAAKGQRSNSQSRRARHMCIMEILECCFKSLCYLDLCLTDKETEAQRNWISLPKVTELLCGSSGVASQTSMPEAFSEPLLKGCLVSPPYLMISSSRGPPALWALWGSVCLIYTVLPRPDLIAGT